MSELTQEEAADRRFELMSGLTLAVLAAALAVTDLGGGTYGDDEIIGTNEKASAYAWYQSKSVKQSLIEQEQGLLRALSEAGVITEQAQAPIAAHITALDVEVQRYKVEKKEILEGSAAVGPSGQVLEKDGQKGQIVGALELEAQLATLGAAGDKFDLATLWLQLSLVLGAMALVLQNDRLKWAFYGSMVLTGALGSIYSVLAFRIAAG